MRVTLTGRLAAARLNMHIDVSVGDPIWPAPTTITLPRLLDGQITLTGYPLPMVHAEKLVTAVQRGAANTRWRDFADVYLLARHHDIDGQELRVAIEHVAGYRQTILLPLADVLDGFVPLAQTRWYAWRRKNRLDDRLPEDFAVVMQEVVITFADPVFTGTAQRRTWSASSRTWTPRN